MRKRTLFPALALVATLVACAAGSRSNEDPRARLSPAQRAHYTPAPPTAIAPAVDPPTVAATVLPPTIEPTPFLQNEPAEAAVANAVNDFPPLGIWAEYLYVAGFVVSFGFLSAVVFFVICFVFATIAFRKYAHLYVGIFSLNRRTPHE